MSSYKQRRQQELAWLLFISAGFGGNLESSRLWNRATYAAAGDQAAIRDLQTALRRFQRKIRNEIRNISS